MRTSAWIAPWTAEALTSLQKNTGALQESNPVWYDWNTDGTIAKVWNAENPTWRAAMTGTEIIPTLQNVISGSFNGTVAAPLLANPAWRAAHVDAIAQLVTSNAFDGIDIDYERIPTTSRADFTAFITALAARLHAAGKKLSVSVYAKTSDQQNWNGPGSQDWIAIGGAADSVKIMAYDYHWSTSGAGAVTPLAWLDQVATYAESAIPAKKIVIGLPWYGYDWPATGAASTVTYSSATQIALNNNAAITHDAASGEATFSYNGRTVFFQDAAAYTAKLDLLKQKHGSIGGVAHWAAGYEDPAVWSALSSSSPVTPAPADFALSGPQQLTVQQGSSATANYTLTPINNFSGTASVTASSPIAATISPVISATQPATLIVTPSSAGTFQITLRVTSGSIVHQQIVTVNVTAAAAGKRRAARH